MSRWIAAAIAACMLLSIAPALAATSGIVRGVVTQSGTPKAGATVTLSGQGQLYSTKTNDKGQYTFPTVTFGRYTLTVHVDGETDRAQEVDVVQNAVSVVNVDVLKTIVVTSTNAMAGVTGSPVAVTTMDQKQIAASPVNNSLNRLIVTVPGAVQFSYNEPVINGFHGVTYEIDGAPMPLATTSNFAEIIDPKEINSLEIFTGAIPAEYGGDRMGGVVSIVTERFLNIPEGTYGVITGGAGSQGQAVGEFDTVSRFGNNELFFSANTSSTNRGLDAPTFDPVHDDSSSSDQFLRWVSRLNDRATLAADFSNQLSQFQIPINPCDPATQGGVLGCASVNPNDPIFAIPGTGDTQVEYDRFANLNYTQTSKDGNGVFQFIPWFRSTRVNYLGDLGANVQGMGPNFGCVPAGDPANFPNCNVDGITPNFLNNVGLQSLTYANYLGLRVSQLRTSAHHTWKVGLDVNRTNSQGSQTYACFYVNCNLPGGSTPAIPATAANGYPLGYYAASSAQAQPGSQTGLYAQDQWQPNPRLVFDYGLRYDHSTGYTSGFMIQPRIGINVSDGGRNIAHVFYGRYYAAPLLEDVRQACVIFSAQNGCATTTPPYDLKPEMDSYYEIGLQHTFSGNLVGWANLFEKNVVNILDTTQLLNTPLFAVYNNAIGHNQGLELRLQDRQGNGNNWFFTATISGSYAGGISGSTFLFPPNINGNIPLTSPAQLSLEDHSQTVDSTGGYTAYFGNRRAWFASLQANYGSGFPVQFQNANGASLTGTLPAHTTFDVSTGRIVEPGKGPDSQGLGVQLQVLNVLNHQYVIKIANGFNTTQIASGRSFLLRFTQPF
jgi:outer membrane receptor protein involved in Fe transport